jgi:hypothetical protein
MMQRLLRWLAGLRKEDELAPKLDAVKQEGVDAVIESIEAREEVRRARREREQMEVARIRIDSLRLRK